MAKLARTPHVHSRLRTKGEMLEPNSVGSSNVTFYQRVRWDKCLRVLAGGDQELTFESSFPVNGKLVDLRLGDDLYKCFF